MPQALGRALYLQCRLLHTINRSLRAGNALGGQFRCQSFYVLPCLRSPVSYIQLYNSLVAVLTLHHCRWDCAAPPG